MSVPPEVDRAVLALARRRLPARTKPFVALRWGAAAAAAAAVLLFLQAWLFQPGDPQDLDGNGRVDILDAFLLARQLDAGGTVRKSWDINGDGVVDHKDVDSIARTAVRVH